MGCHDKPPAGASLLSILFERSRQQADQTAFTFLVDGDEKTESLSYSQLAGRVAALGEVLKSERAGGERALLDI